MVACNPAAAVPSSLISGYNVISDGRGGLEAPNPAAAVMGEISLYGVIGDSGGRAVA